MPKIKYVERSFSAESLKLVTLSNQIIADYTEQGYTLTLRQLYYQMVSRGIIANKLTEYKRLGSIINDARLAGLIDWKAIEDRTRNLRSLSHWDSPSSIVDTCAKQFWMDHWSNQNYRPEVWIEKDALVGVIEGVCNRMDVPFFSCRGYTSQSEMWGAAMRLMSHANKGQSPVIFHLGDHDPSGKDMTRDITDRMELFMGGIELKRLALNMNQVEKYNPPPNPAKITDSRASAYIAEFGNSSWELDALEPQVISKLIEDAVTSLISVGEWKDVEREIASNRKVLKGISDNWERVRKFLGN